jgi:hypothetical protein
MGSICWSEPQEIYMDRNIITDADIRKPEPGIRGADTFPVLIPDDRFQRLLKFIPGESIGLYLGLDGIIRSAESDAAKLRFWLSVVLATCVIFTWFYLRRIWHVKRVSQVVVSTTALVAYVFAIGGVFRELSFYEPWQSSFVMVITTAFLLFFKPPGQRLPRTSVSASRTSDREAKVKVSAQ